jgi:hypothetical protein
LTETSQLAGRRYALIVAISDYHDPKLRQLRAPAADANRLGSVLGDPDIGGFEVQVVEDAQEPALRRQIVRFFSNRRPEDLLLIHFSCHGVKDQAGELYLAAKDTEVGDLLSATAISSGWLRQQIGRSRSKRVVVLLDCCFSGSFPFGMRSRASEQVDVPERLEGRGRAVITASSAMEYAYEGDQLSGEGEPSFFTDAVVEGLESGRADRDGDHWISIDELYDYVYDRVKDKTPNQSPNKKFDLEGPLYLAHSAYEAPVEPATLDEQLRELMEHPVAGARLGAVDELSERLKSANRGVVLAARLALERMVDDDSRRVSDRAIVALASLTTEVQPALERTELHASEHTQEAVEEQVTGGEPPDATRQPPLTSPVADAPQGTEWAERRAAERADGLGEQEVFAQTRREAKTRPKPPVDTKLAGERAWAPYTPGLLSERDRLLSIASAIVVPLALLLRFDHRFGKARYAWEVAQFQPLAIVITGLCVVILVLALASRRPNVILARVVLSALVVGLLLWTGILHIDESNISPAATVGVVAGLLGWFGAAWGLQRAVRRVGARQPARGGVPLEGIVGATRRVTWLSPTVCRVVVILAGLAVPLVMIAPLFVRSSVSFSTWSQEGTSELLWAALVGVGVAAAALAILGSPIRVLQITTGLGAVIAGFGLHRLVTSPGTTQEPRVGSYLFLLVGVLIIAGSICGAPRWRNEDKS